MTYNRPKVDYGFVKGLCLNTYRPAALADEQVVHAEVCRDDLLPFSILLAHAPAAVTEVFVELLLGCGHCWLALGWHLPGRSKSFPTTQRLWR